MLKTISKKKEKTDIKIRTFTTVSLTFSAEKYDSNACRRVTVLLCSSRVNGSARIRESSTPFCVVRSLNVIRIRFYLKKIYFIRLRY